MCIRDSTRSSGASAATSPLPSPACTCASRPARRCRSRRSFAVSKREAETHPSVELGLLYRLGVVDALGTDHGALADEAALPDAVRMGDHRQPLLGPLVARVEVVAARKSNSRRSEELVVQSIH